MTPDLHVVVMLAEHGRDEPVAIGEVVLQRSGVALASRRVDLAERHRLDPPLGEQGLGCGDQPLAA